MIVAFPIEISAREYLSKLFCSYKILSKTNYRVVFGKKSEVYNFYKKNKGIYLITKGGAVEHFAFKKDFPHNKLSLLDEEGPLINFSYNSDFVARTNFTVLEKLSDYFCWGLRDYSMMKKILNEKKLILSGHPKFDLCDKKYAVFFKEKKKILNKKYGKFLLVASSFISADGYIDNDIYSKWIVKAVEKKLRKKKYNDLKKYFSVEKNYYNNLIKFTKKISINHPDLKIIFRPHPRQDVEKVKKRFDKKKYKNIFVIKEGSITPFIYASKYYLHSGCTTSLEAAILGKKIFFLQNQFKNAKILYNKFGVTLGQKDHNLLSKYIKNKKQYNLKKNNINKFIHNNNKFFFNDILIKRLKKVNLQSNDILFGDYSKKIEILSRFKAFIYNSKILISLLSLIYPNILFNKEYKISKFEKIDINKINNDLKKFQNIDKLKFKFTINKINDNAYIFEKKIN